MPSRVAAALVSLFLLTSVVRADASDSGAELPVRLDLHAPAQCLDRQAFLTQLRARSSRIREARGDASAPWLRIDIRRDDAQTYGSLIVGQFGGPLDREERRREVRGPDCESVAASLALVAAIILDPSAALSVDSPVPAQPVYGLPPAGTPSPPVPASLRSGPSLAAPRSTPPAREFISTHLSVGAAFEVAVGLGPDPSLVPRAFVDLELPAVARLSVRLSVGRGSAHAVDTAIGTALITLTDVRFEPCIAFWSRGPLRVRACGIAEGGVLAGDGAHTSAPRSETRGFFELGAGLAPTWLVRQQVIVGFLLAGALPLGRYRFFFASPDTTAYRLAPWSALGEVSVGVRFW